ncbi:MAG: hypothetical protein KBC95_04235 [Candidatus Peribacteraceae bacterium]|nr:hypothetical protein [Candidatus Peribacteraceae bacterium]
MPSNPIVIGQKEANECPLCGLALKRLALPTPDELFYIGCSKCGTYRIAAEYLRHPSWREKLRTNGPALSAEMKEQNKAGEKWPTITVERIRAL